MRPAKSVGRILGVLLFAHLVGLTAGFILLLPITLPEFLENTAAVSSQIRTGVFLLLATSALTVGISIFAFSVFREHSYRMALWLVAVPLPVLLGYRQVLVLAYSMALSYIAMGTWLVIKGFWPTTGKLREEPV